jgi:catechol 2,3-dioxygenase-like lactoylglutathione lyase family enzyme
MAIGIDHIVIVVNDLDAASRDYTTAGFTVVPGGEHTNGKSRNALIAFADGTYFELIAFDDVNDAGGNPWASALQQSGEGLVDFALRTADLDAEVAALRASGITVVGPTDGGRTRPDGQTLAWRTIRFEEPGAPFYCHDVTDRTLRVPGGDATVHANGVTSVHGILLAVGDLTATGNLYAALTGDDGTFTPERARFAAGNQYIDLQVAEGDRPIEVVLNTPEGQDNLLPLELTHGAHLRLTN